MTRNPYFNLAVAASVVTAAVVFGGIEAQAKPTPAHHPSRPTIICARAAFLADDYAHTGVKPDGYHQAIVDCSKQVGGF